VDYLTMLYKLHKLYNIKGEESIFTYKKLEGTRATVMTGDLFQDTVLTSEYVSYTLLWS